MQSSHKGLLKIARISYNKTTGSKDPEESEGRKTMDALTAILTRRSTRKFTDRPVEDEVLQKILEAGRYAPSGGNNQTTHLIVIRDPEVLRALAASVREEFAKMEVTPGMYKSMANSITRAKGGSYVFHYDAPVLILTANKKDYGNNIADCSCVLENMMIAANALDLGTCWINQLKWLNENEVILEKMIGFGMAEDERVWGGLAVGYPDSEDGLPYRVMAERKGNRVTFVG